MKKGCVADTAAWTALWKACRKNEQTPEIDFGKKSVLVALSGDPMNYPVINATVDRNGDLDCRCIITLGLYDGPRDKSRYQLALVSRDGVMTVRNSMLGLAEQHAKPRAVFLQCFTYSKSFVQQQDGLGVIDEVHGEAAQKDGVF